MRIVVLFNLKPGVDPAAYEEWARTTDIPGVRALGSCTDFQVYRTTGLLGGKPSRLVLLLQCFKYPSSVNSFLISVFPH